MQIDFDSDIIIWTGKNKNEIMEFCHEFIEENESNEYYLGFGQTDPNNGTCTLFLRVNDGLRRVVPGSLIMRNPIATEINELFLPLGCIYVGSCN